jgi:hypothetical protein
MIEADMRLLRDENERLSRDNATLRRLVYDIRDYALTPQPVLRSIEQAFLAIAERASESRGISDETLAPEEGDDG